MYYKKVSGNNVRFGYKFDNLQTLFNSKSKLINSIKNYCLDTNKVYESTTFVCDGFYVFELSISKWTQDTI